MFYEQILKFAWFVFAGTVVVASIISSNVNTESPIIPTKHLSFSQVHVLGYQI